MTLEFRFARREGRGGLPWHGETPMIHAPRSEMPAGIDPVLTEHNLAMLASGAREPEDIAEAITSLISDRACNARGVSMPVDCTRVAGRSGGKGKLRR